MITINEEEIIDEELMPMKDWIVNIPKTKKELYDRFSLTNNEIHIDNVSFSDTYNEAYDLFRVKIPTSKNNLNRFFI